MAGEMDDQNIELQLPESRVLIVITGQFHNQLTL
jgi:hypothetical protein